MKEKKFLEKEDGKIVEIKNVKEIYLESLSAKKFDTASEILVKYIKSKNYIYTTKDDNKPEIYIYKDGIYVPEGKSEIEEQLRKKLGASYNQWIVKKILDKIRADTFIEPEEFFKERNKYQIPLQNGILNLKTIELKPFDPKEIYFSKLPVHFDANANCPKIEKFLKDVLANEEDINIIYEIAGLALVKEYFLEKAIMMVGSGRNGKSKTIELLKRFVGAKNCSGVPLSSITSNSPFVSDLFGKLLNLAGDISSKDLKETGMLKQLIGRDVISANRKYKNVINFQNYAKFIFACNELPRVYDYSDGFWERWILLEFPYYFADEEKYNKTKEEDRINWKIKDPNIIEQITLPMEMSGFLNMAIAGLHRLMINKKFSYSKGTSEVKNKWIRKADSFVAFCMDNIEESYESVIVKKELRKKYHEYCKKYRVRKASDRSIKITLEEQYGALEEYKSLFLGGNQEYSWVGIRFLSKN